MMGARAPLLGGGTSDGIRAQPNNKQPRVEWFNGYGNVILTVTYTTNLKGMIGRVGLGFHLL